MRGSFEHGNLRTAPNVKPTATVKCNNIAFLLVGKINSGPPFPLQSPSPCFPSVVVLSLVDILRCPLHGGRHAGLAVGITHESQRLKRSKIAQMRRSVRGGVLHELGRHARDGRLGNLRLEVVPASNRVSNQPSPKNKERQAYISSSSPSLRNVTATPVFPARPVRPFNQPARQQNSPKRKYAKGQKNPPIR